MEELKKELSISDKDRKINFRREEAIGKLKDSIAIFEGIIGFLYGLPNRASDEQRRSGDGIERMKQELGELEEGKSKALKDYSKVLMDTTLETLKQLRKKIEAYEAMRGLIRKWFDSIDDGDIASTPFFRTISENQKDAPRAYNSIMQRLEYSSAKVLMQSEINIALAQKQLTDELLASPEGMA